MADIFSQEKRSWIMSRVKSKNTKLEIRLRKELWRRGYKYRIKNSLPGHPDLIFKKVKLAIFIDGDFWHGYGWNKLKPKLKNEFWINKIKNNRKRDKLATKKLIQDGWQVLRFWGHDVNKDLEGCISKIDQLLRR